MEGVTLYASDRLHGSVSGFMAKVFFRGAGRALGVATGPKLVL